jgi:hypothetical protein
MALVIHAPTLWDSPTFSHRVYRLVAGGSAEVAPQEFLCFLHIAKREHVIGDDGDPKSIHAEKRDGCENGR